MSDTRQLGLWERWRSYLVFNPLIYFYTFVLGTLSLLSSLFDRSGRAIVLNKIRAVLGRL